MAAFDLFSIGHSNIPIDRFVALLSEAHVKPSQMCARRHIRGSFRGSRAIICRRIEGQPASLISPMAKLSAAGRADASLYCDGVADYEAMARTAVFQSGLDRLQTDMAKHRVCLMCAEREPLDCHRCLLVSRALAARGVAIGHILHDGSIEPHSVTEQRLMQWAESAAAPDLFVTGQEERLAAAYRRRGRAVGYKAKPGTAGAKTVAEQK